MKWKGSVERENGDRMKLFRQWWQRFLWAVTVHLLDCVHRYYMRTKFSSCVCACENERASEWASEHVCVYCDPFLVVQLFASKSVRFIQCSLACVTMILHLVTTFECSLLHALIVYFSYVIWMLDCCCLDCQPANRMPQSKCKQLYCRQ